MQLRNCLRKKSQTTIKKQKQTDKYSQTKALQINNEAILQNLMLDGSMCPQKKKFCYG